MKIGNREKFFASDDRYSISYCLIAVILLLILAVHGEIVESSWLYKPNEILSFFISFFTLPAATIAYFIGVVLKLAQGRWRASLSISVAPFFGAALYFALPQVGVTPFRIFFETAAPSFDREIEKLAGNKAHPRMKSFDWGESPGGFGTIVVVTKIIYDESDQIGLPANERSVAWRERAKIELSPFIDSGRVRHIRGHYYAISILF